MYDVYDAKLNRVLYSSRNQISAYQWKYNNIDCLNDVDHRFSVIQQTYAGSKREAFETALIDFDSLVYMGYRAWYSGMNYERQLSDDGHCIRLYLNDWLYQIIHYMETLYNAYGEEGLVYEVQGGFAVEIPAHEIKLVYKTYEKAYNYLYNKGFRK